MSQQNQHLVATILATIGNELYTKLLAAPDIHVAKTVNFASVFNHKRPLNHWLLTLRGGNHADKYHCIIHHYGETCYACHQLRFELEDPNFMQTILDYILSDVYGLSEDCMLT